MGVFQKEMAAYGLGNAELLRNRTPAELYELALSREHGSQIAGSGALVALSGERTGRSPADKRVVREAGTEDEVWWGPVNIPLTSDSFEINRERALDYLHTRKRLYVVDGYAGWDPAYRLKVRVICARAYHALFMHNMLIRPTAEELDRFEAPDFVVLNAGGFPANAHTTGMSSKTSVDLSFSRRELIILGTEYAGEMKKGVFTVMNYLMPKRGVLSMHCSATLSRDGAQSCVLFGLSGTGKTTLSADPHRLLIGDDEHCWTDDGLFNIEGGCYAKVIDLNPEQEPALYRAIRFGTVLENVVLAPDRNVEFGNTTITKNTRASYPIEYIDDVQIPCVGPHPKDVIFLTADAFGVLPPVAKLDANQAMYHFMSGYTAKVAGTEVGINEPEATFSPCFGGPFLVWHPARYAELLKERLQRHGSQAWLVNTGWTGGPFGVGRRMSLPHTRAIVEGIVGGRLQEARCEADPIFGFQIPTECDGVPARVLQPRSTWVDGAAYDATAKKLAAAFHENFRKYEAQAGPDILSGGPKI